jgi:dienelactone hydrolase
MSGAEIKKGCFRRSLAWGLPVVVAVLIAGWMFYDRDYAGYFQETRGTFAGATVSPVSQHAGLGKSWLTVKSKAGFVVECGMLTPPDDGHKHPAIILLGGKATGKHAVDYALDVTGMIIVAVDYPYTPRDTYTITNFLGDVPAIRNALFDMIPSVMLVIDYLLTRGDVDSSKIVLLGYSFGAPFVPCIIAHDHRPAVAAMVYGGGDMRSLITHNVRRYEGEVISQFVGTLAGALLYPLEPMRFVGRVAPTPLIMINGTEDEQVPRHNVELLYNAAGEPKSITWLESRHVRPDNAGLTRSILAVLKRQLALRGIVGDGAR